MSKTIYDIDQAGNVLCTYVDSEKQDMKAVRPFNYRYPGVTR